MEKVYTICVAIGFGIPFLSFVFGKIFDLFDGIFDGIFDFFNFDFSFEIGDTSVSFLPFSIQSICGGLLMEQLEKYFTQAIMPFLLIS